MTGLAVLGLSVVVAVVLGNPLIVLVGLILGAIVANRSTYRSQAKAIRRELRE